MKYVVLLSLVLGTSFFEICAFKREMNAEFAPVYSLFMNSLHKRAHFWKREKTCLSFLSAFAAKKRLDEYIKQSKEEWDTKIRSDRSFTKEIKRSMTQNGKRWKGWCIKIMCKIMNLKKEMKGFKESLKEARRSIVGKGRLPDADRAFCLKDYID